MYCLYLDSHQRLGMAALCKIQLQNEAARIVTELTRSGYKTYYMLNSARHEVVPVHKC